MATLFETIQQYIDLERDIRNVREEVRRAALVLSGAQTRLSQQLSNQATVGSSIATATGDGIHLYEMPSGKRAVFVVERGELVNTDLVADLTDREI